MSVLLAKIVVEAFNLSASVSRSLKKDFIYEVLKVETRPPSSIALLSSSDAHMPIVGAFGGGRVSAWAP